MVQISEDMVLKVADFGLARPVADTMTTQSGTLKWMAPEQLSKGNYTQKSDVYRYIINNFKREIFNYYLVHTFKIATARRRSGPMQKNNYSH